MIAKFTYTEDKDNIHVICDTNVWYNIANGIYVKPTEVTLIATSLTLAELASSETMASSLHLFQSVLNTVHDNSGPIVPVNPLDFVLMKHDPDYPADHESTKKVLNEFSKVMSADIPPKTELSAPEKAKLIESCKENRKGSVEFAEFGTNALIQIRKNINKGVGKKEHLKVDTKEVIREMMKSILQEHAKKVDYTINFDSFDWGNLEFFLTVTENYFKKLETTRDMKIKPNDAVDWLNMLYVTPVDKYLTFEKSWRKLIESDERTSKYLFS